MAESACPIDRREGVIRCAVADRRVGDARYASMRVGVWVPPSTASGGLG